LLRRAIDVAIGRGSTPRLCSQEGTKVFAHSIAMSYTAEVNGTQAQIEEIIHV